MNEPKPKYWICSDCANKKGWVFPKWPVTTVIGICGYCKEPIETTLIPIVDFDKKDGKPVVVD